MKINLPRPRQTRDDCASQILWTLQFPGSLMDCTHTAHPTLLHTITHISHVDDIWPRELQTLLAAALLGVDKDCRRLWSSLARNTPLYASVSHSLNVSDLPCGNAS